MPVLGHIKPQKHGVNDKDGALGIYAVHALFALGSTYITWHEKDIVILRTEAHRSISDTHQKAPANAARVSARGMQV